MSWKHGDSGYMNHGCRCDECRSGYALAEGMRAVARGRRLGFCTVAECGGYQYAKGLCKAHYERQRTGRRLGPPIHRRPGALVYDRPA